MEFKHFIRTGLTAPHVYIQTHDFPDPDAIGSACGIHHILKHYGINTEICYAGHVTNDALHHLINEYDISLREASEIHDMSISDKIILIDGQKLNANMTDLPGEEVACIDHHPDNEQVMLAYEDIRPCGACTSIITEYFRLLEVPLDKKTATLLLYGLQMDTDNLRRGVTSLDIEAFSYLFSLADGDMLKRLAGRTMRERDLRAFGAAIETIELTGHLAIAFIPFACDDYLIAQIADFMLALSEVDLSIVYSKRENGLKFSARTLLPDVHCGNLLKTCLGSEGGNGGGHPHMAGGFIPREKLLSLYDNNLSCDSINYNLASLQEHLIKKINIRTP